MSWTLLIVVIPLIIVPVVLLFGFAGCAGLLGLEDVQYAAKIPAPTNLAGTATDPGGKWQVMLTWQHPSPGTYEFVISRDDSPEYHVNSQVDPLAYTDLSVNSGTSYRYKVKARQPGQPQSPSDPSNEVTVKVPTWNTAYDQPLGSNDGVHAGACLVQRIDKGNYQSLTGKVLKVRIALRAGPGANGPIVLRIVTVSHAAPAGNEYDSETQPLTVGTAITLNPGAPALTTAPVAFPLDQGKDLIVAFDIDSTSVGRLGTRTNAAPSVGFINGGTTAAASTQRSATGYNDFRGTVFLVEKIEVLTV